MKVEDCCWTFRLHRGTRAELKLHAQARAQRRGGRCLELVVLLLLLLLRLLARRDAEAGRGLPRGRRARGCRVGRHWVLPRCLSLAGGDGGEGGRDAMLSGGGGRGSISTLLAGPEAQRELPHG